MFLSTFSLILSLSLLSLAELDIPEENIPEQYRNKENVMRYDPPDLNEEESHSVHMPTRLRCDACKAISYVLSQHFDKLKLKFKSRSKPPEEEIMDAVEGVCNVDNFENYGVKKLVDQTVLSGPGLPGETIAGMMQGGGRWPIRINKMCLEYVGEMEESELYDHYRQSKNTLNDALCWARTGVFADCVRHQLQEMQKMANMGRQGADKKTMAPPTDSDDDEGEEEESAAPPEVKEEL